MSSFRECGLCGDTRWVTIWHMKTVTRARHHKATGDEMESRHHVTSAIPCKCTQADGLNTWSTRNGDKRDWMDRYGDRWWHCRVQHRTRVVNGKRYWYTDPMEDCADLKPPNYEAGFDDWNERGDDDTEAPH